MSLVLLYYYGARWPSVHHARMKIGCSKLKYDLCYNLHVIDSPQCTCGSPVENAYHFFLECPIFNAARNALTISMQGLADMTIPNLLYGNPGLSLDENRQVFHAVHEFILNTKRFD